MGTIDNTRHAAERSPEEHGGEPGPDHSTGASPARLRRRPKWMLSALGAVLLIPVTVVIQRHLTPDTRLTISVVQPTAKELLALPHSTPATIVAYLDNDGEDVAKDVTVRVDSSVCARHLTVEPRGDAAAPPSGVTCEIPPEKIRDDAGTLTLSASMKGSEQTATDEFEVKWAPLRCPDYSKVLTQPRPVLGHGSLADVRTRWNSTLDLLEADGCGEGLGQYRIDSTASRSAFGVGANGGDTGWYRLELDRDADPETVTGVVVTLEGDAVRDEAWVMRLLAAVTATDPQVAELLVGPETGASASTTSSSVRPCGAVIPGVEITKTSLGTDRQISVRVCSTR